MIARFLPTGAAIACSSLLLACTDDGRESRPLAPPSFDLTAVYSVSGNILGPDGTSICNAVPPGSLLLVRLINPATGGFGAVQNVSCPANSYTVFVAPASYLLRVQLPGFPGLGALPWRTLDATPVVVDVGDVVRDMQIQPGTGLGGQAMLDGAPLPGVDLSVIYDQAPGFGATSGSSGADGGWVEFFGREPLILQNGIRYLVSTICSALGTKVVQTPPSTSFLFPTERSAVDCALTTAPNTRFSHTRTRLVVTPMPGDIGGLSPELQDQFGEGWGVQFPIAPGQPPIHGSVNVSQLFEGGLIVGIRPDRVLSGVELGGYMQCGGACRDFGLDGKFSFASSPQFGTKVIWHYSDATSPEGVGLKVLQKSYDGVPPNDYVLFRFIFTNSGVAPVTFYAGMFADWDIGDDFLDDVGFTAMDGRLMYMTDATPGGVYAGTLLLGDFPVSGNAFLTDFGQSTATQVAALAGDFTVPSAPAPGDHRYLQALGPISLGPNASADIWIAVVAGEDQSQLFANANAAVADVARRRADQSSDAASGGVTTEGSVWGGNGGGRPHTGALNPACKRGCTPQ